MKQSMAGVFAAVAAVALLSASMSERASALDWGKKEIETELVAVKLTREVLKGGYGIVRTDELKAWIDSQKDMLIVDTMPAESSYDKKHIPGAVQFEFPIEEVGDLGPERQEAYRGLLGADKGRLIVIYCGFTKCGRSHNGALWAQKLGYSNVVRYPGGIKAWEQAGHSIEKVR